MHRNIHIYLLQYLTDVAQPQKRRHSIFVAMSFMAVPIPAARSRLGQDHIGRENTRMAAAMGKTMVEMVIRLVLTRAHHEFYRHGYASLNG